MGGTFLVQAKNISVIYAWYKAQYIDKQAGNQTFDLRVDKCMGNDFVNMKD